MRRPPQRASGAWLLILGAVVAVVAALCYAKGWSAP